MDRYNASGFLRRVVDDLGVPGQVVVRPICTVEELDRVYQLTHDCYVASGYAKPNPSGMLIHYPEFDHISQTTVLVAVRDGLVLGTISLTLDSPKGFTIDEDFKAECDSVRAEGAPVGVVWRLAVEKAERSNRTVLVQLINAVMEVAIKKGVRSWLFSVNPKHANVYRRMLAMDVVGRQETTEGLENAPAILLRGWVERLYLSKVPGIGKPTIRTFQLAA